MQPATVVELGLEGARSRRQGGGLVQPGANLRHAADLDHGFIGGARRHRYIRQLVQALEVRIAQHQAVVRVPQHEGFRNGLDRIAQPQVGLDGLLREALLLGDVDGNADQMQPGIARGVTELAADAQPDPVTIGVPHPEGLVDLADLGGDQLVGDLEQVDVIGIHQRVDLAEGQQVAAGVEAQHREHRLRPEDAAARQVPIPQSTAAAVERGIDPAAHRVIDEVAFAGAGRLPVECETQDQHHEAGGSGQRDGQRGVGPPE